MLKTKENRRYQLLCNCVLTVMTLFMIFPFVLLFMSSVTEENTLIMNGYSLFPQKFSLGHISTFSRMGRRYSTRTESPFL